MNVPPFNTLPIAIPTHPNKLTSCWFLERWMGSMVAVGDGTFVADGRKMNLRTLMAGKIPDGIREGECE